MRTHMLLVVAMIALMDLAVAPGRAAAQVGTGTIMTSPASSPTYYTPVYYSTPVSRTIITPITTNNFTPRSYITPVYRTYTPPSNTIAYSPDRTSYATTGNTYVQSFNTHFPANNNVYTMGNGYPYYNALTGTHYHAPTFNPGAVYGGFSSNYPTSYAPYRSFWFGISRFRVWSPTR